MKKIHILLWIWVKEKIIQDSKTVMMFKPHFREIHFLSSWGDFYCISMLISHEGKCKIIKMSLNIKTNRGSVQENCPKKTRLFTCIAVSIYFCLTSWERVSLVFQAVRGNRDTNVCCVLELGKSIYVGRIPCKSLIWGLDGWLLRTEHANWWSCRDWEWHTLFTLF